MIKLEIRKNIFNILFVVSVFLLYFVFLTGGCENVLPGGEGTTIFGAIWNKCHGNWQVCSDSSCFVRMYHMWTDNAYLPVLAPIFCGLPGVINYFREAETGNKRWMLSRSSLRRYYMSKIVGNIASALMIALVAVGLYYGSLLIFFDRFSIHSEEFINVYIALSGRVVEKSSALSYGVIIRILCKGVFYFLIYAVQSASFFMWIAVWCKERYFGFCTTIFLCYLQVRLVQELSLKSITDNVPQAGVAADILNPVFLYYAGNSGFYQEREGLAVLLAFLLIGIHSLLFVRLLQRRFDLGNE